MFQKVKSKGLLSIFILGSGNMIGTVISAIALILFSRFMGPSEFGLFSAGLAAMQIVIRLTDLGINMATERTLARAYGRDQDLVDRLARVGFWLKITCFTICVSLGWILAPWISVTLLHIENIAIIRLAFLLSIGTVLFEYTTVIFQASQRFAIVARITVAQAVGKLLVGLILIWQGALGSITAMLLYGIMPGIGALLGWVKAPFTSYSLPSSWKKDLSIIMGVAKWTGIAAVSATMADNIDTLMVQSFMSSYDTGVWSGAVRIATFGSLLGWTIGSVLSNRVASYSDPKHLREYLKKAWKISLLSFVVLCLGIPFAKLAIILTVGSAYLGAVFPLQILLVAMGIASAISPYSALFYLFDRPQYYAWAGVITTIVLVVGDYIFIPIHGLVGAAVVRVVVKISVLVFTVFYVKKSLKSHFAKI